MAKRSSAYAAAFAGNPHRATAPLKAKGRPSWLQGGASLRLLGLGVVAFGLLGVERVVQPVHADGPVTPAGMASDSGPRLSPEPAVLDGGLTPSPVSLIGPKSVFEPSPVDTPNQWVYGRVARVYPNDAGVYALYAGDAEYQGPSIQYLQDRAVSGNHYSKDDRMTWQLAPAVQSGTYEVHAIYGSPAAGHSIRVRIAGQTVTKELANTGGYNRSEKHQLGTVRLVEGKAYTLTLAGHRMKEGTGLMDLKGIELAPVQSPHRWFDTETRQWTRRIPPSLRFGNGRTPDQRPPAHLIKGGPKGYAIITTNAIRKDSKELANFVDHKAALGFDTMVITEDDFGGGHGPDAADNIRQWLHENYEEKQILYTLLIGSPHPTHGDIPMMATNTDLADFRRKIAAGEHPHAGIPTDLFYADCSGPTADLSGDNRIGEGGDYHPADGLDSMPDVYVGRIPYYGEQSQWGKIADVDAILRKTINYENATPAEILERYRFEVDGLTMGGHLPEWAGFEYVTREQNSRGYLTEDHHSWLNNSFMDQHSVGFLRSGGHANPVWIESGVSSGWLASRAVPKDTLNTFGVYGGCDCSQPEHPMNMAYMHLRQGAIATVGASRSVAGVRGHGPLVRPDYNVTPRSSALFRGHSLGQGHWEMLTSGRQRPNGGAKMFTFYGDPSVVPFPQKLKPTRNMVVRPAHDLEHFEGHDTDERVRLYEQEYDLQNTSGQELAWSLKVSDAPWLDVQATRSGILKAGEIVTIQTSIKALARELPIGRYQATLTFQVGDQTLRRAFFYEKTGPGIALRESFDKEEDGVYDTAAKGKSYEYREHLGVAKPLLANPINRTVSFDFKPAEKLGQRARIFHNDGLTVSADPATQKLQLRWEPYSYGEQAWNKQYIIEQRGDDVDIVVRGRTPLKLNQWNQISFSIDFDRRELLLFLNGRFEGKGKLGPHYFGFNRKTYLGDRLKGAFDNLLIRNGRTERFDAAQEYRGGLATISTAPMYDARGVSRLPRLAWSDPNDDADTRYRVYLSRNRAQLQTSRPTKAGLIKETDETSYEVNQKLQANATYFWRVDRADSKGRVKRMGKVWSFTTGQRTEADPTQQPNQAPAFAKAVYELPPMSAKNNLYTYEFVRDVTDESPDKLTFRMLEGPSWVTVQPGGRVFSYHGAPADAVGKHRLAVEVTDERGLTAVANVTLNVRPEGEITLLPAYARLAEDQPIRLNGQNLVGLASKQSEATWSLAPAVTDRYDVIIELASPHGGTAKLTVDGRVIDVEIPSTENWRTFKRIKIATVSLKAGKRIELSFRPETFDRAGLCDIRQIMLKPAE